MLLQFGTKTNATICNMNNEDASNSSSCSNDVTDTDKENSSNSRSHQTPDKKRKIVRYKQKFNYGLEKQYKWIQKSESPYHFRCKICGKGKDYTLGKTEIVRHENSAKHIAASSAIKKQPLLTDHFALNRTEQSVKEAEIKIAAFVTEHNLAFSVADHLTQLIKSVCSDSKVAENIVCARTKCTGIVQNVLGPYNSQKLLDLMKNEKFSLIVDESTDKGCTKHLAMVVRIRQGGIRNAHVEDLFLTLVPIKDASAQSLFNSITDFFNTNNIPYHDNMVGFASDGANVMMGQHHSLSSLFKEEIPSLFIMKCICHSFALCCSYACKELPEGIENFVREIFKYFQYSSKKFEEYKSYQEFCKLKPHKLLHPAQTRWLSLVAVVRRVLEQWNALKLFFTTEVSSTKSESANIIYNKFQNVFYKLYLQFLDYILPYMTDLNKQMQSEKPQIYILFEKVQLVYKTVLEFFIKPECFKTKEYALIDYKNPHNLLDLNEIYLGGNVTSYLCNNIDNIPVVELTKFKLTCLKFYQTLLDQLNMRFPLNSKSPLKLLSVVVPKNILDKCNPSIISLVMHFPNVISESDYNNIDREWRLLLNYVSEQNIDCNEFEEFWNIIENVKNGSDEQTFSLLLKIVNHIKVLPHSSATVERVFSAVNLNKTKIRNRLSTKTITSILQTKQMFNNKVTSCYNIDASKMVNMMTTKIIYNKNSNNLEDGKISSDEEYEDEDLDLNM